MNTYASINDCVIIIDGDHIRIGHVEEIKVTDKEEKYRIRYPRSDYEKTIATWRDIDQLWRTPQEFIAYTQEYLSHISQDQLENNRDGFVYKVYKVS